MLLLPKNRQRKTSTTGMREVLIALLLLSPLELNDPNPIIYNVICSVHLVSISYIRHDMSIYPHTYIMYVLLAWY